MEKGILLNRKCVLFDVSSRLSAQKNLCIRDYSGNNIDVGIYLEKEKGRFKIVKEDELLQDLLDKGFGIYYLGKVYFLESMMNKSSYYLRFKQAFNKFNEKIESKEMTSSDEYLLREVAPHQIAVIKSITSLYDNGFFKESRVKEKLSKYLEESKIAHFLQLRISDKANQALA